ncbi:MAG: carbonic anhydrase [Microbacteriaceae bacterium]
MVATHTDNLTPGDVWALLVAGNERFVRGEPEHPRQDVERRAAVSSSQHPRVAIFGCSDSRLSAEIIFDIGLGDAFVVRNAGQVISDSVIGSLEYAVGVLGVHVILVLGHDSCGAVRAAIDTTIDGDVPATPYIQGLVDQIIPAVKRVVANAPDAPADAGRIGQEHLRDTVAALIDSSELISQAIASGQTAIVGANYQLADGRVATDIVVGDLSATSHA